MAEKSFQTDIRKERKRKKRIQRFRRLAAALAVLLLACAVFFTRGAWMPFVNNIIERTQDTVINKGELAEGNFPIDLGEGSTSSTFDECDGDLVVATDTYITFYNDSADKINQIQHTFTSPKLSTSDEMVLAYDLGGYSFSAMNKKGEIFKKTLDNAIISAKISASNYIAVITSTEKYSSYLTVYNEKGRVCFKWANGQRITGLTFDSSGGGCFVSSLKAEGGMPCTTVSKLKFNSDKAVFVSDSIEAFVYDAAELSDGNVWAVCSDRYVKLDSSGKILGSYEYRADLISYDFTSDILSVVTKGITDDGSSDCIIIESGEDPVMVDINESVKSLKTFLSQTFLLTDKRILVYNTSGREIAEAAVSSDYVDFIYFDKNVYFLGYRDINKTEFEY